MMILAGLAVADALTIVVVYIQLRMWRVLGLLSGLYNAAFVTLFIVNLNLDIARSILQIPSLLPWCMAFMIAAGYGVASQIVVLLRERQGYRLIRKWSLEMMAKRESIAMDILLSRYPEDLVREVRGMAMRISRRVLACHASLWASLLLGAAVVATPSLWLPTIGQPVPPMLSDPRLLLFAVYAFLLIPLGPLILSGRWPYAGLAAIFLSLAMSLAIFHAADLQSLSLAILALGAGGGASYAYKKPEELEKEE